MKMNEYKLALVCTAALVFSVHGSGTSIPFSEGFEGFAVDTEIATDPWNAPGLPGEVLASPQSPDGSSRILYSPDQIFLNIDTNTSAFYFTNMWWSAYARALPHSEEPDIDDEVASFYLDDTGRLFASDTGSWVEIGDDFNTDQWHRFSLHFDFKSGLYDVYAAKHPNANASSMTRMNSNPLAFNQAAPELLQFEVEGETYLDLVTLSRGFTPIVAEQESDEQASTATEAPRLVREGTTFTAPDIRGFGTGTMNGEFGKALASWLLPDDKVSIYDSEEGWIVFTYLGDYDWDVSGGGDVDDYTITAMTGIRVDKDPQNIGDHKAPTHVYTVKDPEPEATVNLRGSGSWNLVSLPHASAPLTPAGLDLPDAENGDMLAINDAGGSFRIVRYNNGAWHPSWNLGEIEPGTSFWYYRAGSDGEEWKITF